MPSNDWNPSLYDQKHAFVSEYGKDLISLLEPKPGELILRPQSPVRLAPAFEWSLRAHLTGELHEPTPLPPTPAMRETYAPSMGNCSCMVQTEGKRGLPENDVPSLYAGACRLADCSFFVVVLGAKTAVLPVLVSICGKPSI